MDPKQFERALFLRDTGQIEDALREFETLANLEQDPCEKSSLLLNQVGCLVRLGRVGDARERWSESAKYWTNSYTEYLDACLCVNEGRKEEALQKLVLFLECHEDLLREPGNEDLCSEASERLAYVLFDRTRYTDAIHAFDKALAYPETDERRRQLCFYLGVCHIEAGDLETAERNLMASLPANCDDSLWIKVQLQLGRLHFQKGAYSKAKSTFELCRLVTDKADIQGQNNISRWLAEIARYLPAKNSKEQRN